MDPLKRLEDLRTVAPVLVIAFFLLSIVFSALSADPVSMALWVLFGVLGVIFLKVAFPQSFLYGLWLLVIYILAGFAVIFFHGIGLTGAQGIGVGILLEVLAVYIVYNLIFQVKGLRDVGEGPYVPLGLWAVTVVLFLVFANAGMMGLMGWVLADGGDASLNAYLAFEVLLVVVSIFIFIRAEQCVTFMEKGTRAMRDTGGIFGPFGLLAPGPGRPVAATAGAGRKRKRPSRSRRKVARGRGRGGGSGSGARRRGSKKVSKGKPCPVCGSPVRVRRRICPECGKTERTGICRENGHIFLPCPSCGTANHHTEYTCRKCGAKLDETILCTSCGKESPMRSWKKAVGKGER